MHVDFNTEMKNTTLNFICIFVILFGFYVLFESRLELFSPVNTYDVHDNSPPKSNLVTELDTTKPSPESVVPSTKEFTSFLGKFPLTPAFIQSLSKEFPDFSFNPEITDLKISPNNNQFVFKITGITKSGARLVRLIVLVELQNPLNYMRTDGEFFIPPDYITNYNDFTLVGVSIDPEATQSGTSVQPFSPFLSTHYRILNKMFLMIPPDSLIVQNSSKK
jgi:hypothetical protein